MDDSERSDRLERRLVEQVLAEMGFFRLISFGDASTDTDVEELTPSDLAKQQVFNRLRLGEITLQQAREALRQLREA